MVVDKDLKPLHELTEEGKSEYSRLLEAIADDILLKHQHPFRWAIEHMKELFIKE